MSTKTKSQSHRLREGGQTLALALVCFCVLAAGGCRQSTLPTPKVVPATDVAESQAALGTRFMLPSDVYEEPREVNVYVPQIPEWGLGYFDTPLPVLYVIDGGLDQDFFHIAALSNLTLLNAERQPMIVVGVRTHNRRVEISPNAEDRRYQGGDFEGWGGSKAFLRHLLHEVKPFVESRFATGRQAVIGESLAGLFIVETFLDAPESFDDYIAISPSLWWDDRRLSKQAPALLERHKESDRRLYLSMADEGGTMRLGLEELLESLKPHRTRVEVKFVDRAESDTHSSIYHHAARDAFMWLYGIPAKPYGQIPWYLEIDGVPPE